MKKYLKMLTLAALALLLLFVLSACANQTSAQPTPVPDNIIAASQYGGDPVAGMLVFNDHCFECHSTEEGQAIAGPSLFGAGAKFSYQYVKQSIQEPHEIITYVDNPQFEDVEMPEGIAAELSQQDFEDVIAYLLSQIEAAGN
jgi:mono/diheme cytochrome c family protein